MNKYDLFTRFLFLPLSLSLYLFYFPSLSLALLFSLNLRLSTLSNGCAGPFCIRDTYHLRVRRPKNRSVSRNNTRCHGHPSTGAHTNVTGTFKRSKVVNVQVGNLANTFFRICQIENPTKSGTDKELISSYRLHDRSKAACVFSIESCLTVYPALDNR